MKIWKVTPTKNSMVLKWHRGEGAPKPELYQENFNGNSMINWWKPVLVEVAKKGRIQDFPLFISHAPILSMKAINVLDPLIGNHVEYLDACVIDNPLEVRFVNVTRVVNALDYKRSNIDWSKKGKISYIWTVSFLQDALKSYPIFKIPEQANQTFYVSDEFRDLVLSSKLKGFEFQEVWDSEYTEEVHQQRQAEYDAGLAAIERNKGPEFDWAEAVRRIDAGGAVASGRWKVQNDKAGNLLTGQFQYDGSYSWFQPVYFPPIFIDMQWHEVERSETEE